MTRPEMRPGGEVHQLLHALWSKAVGTPDYDKEQWRALETVLLDAYEPLRCDDCGWVSR